MRLLVFFWVIRSFAAFNLTWGVPAINLDTNPPFGDTDINARVAIDAGGNTIAVWSRTVEVGASEEIWVSLFNHTSRIWSGPFKISSGSSSNPQALFDSEGNALILWEGGFPTQIHFRTLSKKGVWQPSLEQTAYLLHSSLNPQTNPYLAVDAKDNLLAIWLESSDNKSTICAARKEKNSNWKSFGKISGEITSLHPLKPLVMQPSGDAAVVWEKNGLILGTQFKANRWESPIEISEGKNATLAFDPTGQVHFVWEKEGLILSRSLDLNGLTETIEISDPIFPASHPDIGIDAKGQGIIVFERRDAMSQFIAGSIRKDGSSTWSKPIDISGPSSLDKIGAGYPVFSINAIGDGALIWKEAFEESIVIQAAGFSLGTWSPAKTLSELIGNVAHPFASLYDVGIALNSAGNIVAVWPEDLTGKGTAQIKATIGIGLANQAPLPPILTTHLLQDNVLTLSPPIGDDIRYNLPPETSRPPEISRPPEVVRVSEVARSPGNPGYASGYQEFHRFAAHGDLINILDWASPGGVAYFRIYRGSFRNLIGTTQIAHFEDHQRTFKKKEMYLITSVDEHEQESAPATIFVNPR